MRGGGVRGDKLASGQDFRGIVNEIPLKSQREMLSKKTPKNTQTQLSKINSSSQYFSLFALEKPGLNFQLTLKN